MKDSDKRSRLELAEQNQKLKYASQFIEELSWLLDDMPKSRKNFSLYEISQILKSVRLDDTNYLSIGGDEYKSSNPNIHYLIGILPRLFQDRELFRTNDEIGDFAEEVLGIKISRIEKRSKYELIGLIVCETNDLSDRNLEKLVSSLRLIVENEDKIKFIADSKHSSGFSWNLAIRQLSR